MSEAGAIVRFFRVLRGDAVRRLFALLVLSLGAGAFVTEYTRLPVDDIQVGGVASRSIRAVTSFPFVDWEATLERQRSEESRVQPVFDFDTTLSGRLRGRIGEAFEMSRHRCQSLQTSPAGLPRKTDSLGTIRTDFLAALGLSLDPTTLDRVVAQGFSVQMEHLVVKLVSGELGRFIIADRSRTTSCSRRIAAAILGARCAM